MKRLILAAAIAAVGSAAQAASTSVKGYFKSDGTYVQPHYRTTPDSSRMNNWSTQGNVNPYSGKSGTKPLYESPRLKPYGR